MRISAGYVAGGALNVLRLKVWMHHHSEPSVQRYSVFAVALPALGRSGACAPHFALCAAISACVRATGSPVPREGDAGQRLDRSRERAGAPCVQDRMRRRRCAYAATLKLFGP